MKTNNNTLKNIIVITGEESKNKTNQDIIGSIFGSKESKGLKAVAKSILDFASSLIDVRLSFIGGDDKVISVQGIVQELRSLKNTINQENFKPLIIINIHGQLKAVSKESAHCLIPDKTRNCVPTFDFMKLINKTFEKPVDVILASCHAGAAANYVHLLPKGSKLITLRSDYKEIDTSYIIKTAEYLAQNQPTEISTLDILKAYFISGACNETDAYPCINISGYKKESDFATYLSKRTKKYTEEILERKETVVNHILDALYSEALENEINQLGSMEAKYKFVVTLIEQSHTQKVYASSLKHVQDMIKEINNFDDQIQRAEQQELSPEDIADLFSDYWFSDNKIVTQQELESLKNMIIGFVDSNMPSDPSRKDTIIADYYKCMVNPDEIPELMGDS